MTGKAYSLFKISAVWCWGTGLTGCNSRQYTVGLKKWHVAVAVLVAVTFWVFHRTYPIFWQCSVAWCYAAAVLSGCTTNRTGWDDPERHSQRVYGPQYVHISTTAVDADYCRYFQLSLQGAFMYDCYCLFELFTDLESAAICLHSSYIYILVRDYCSYLNQLYKLW